MSTDKDSRYTVGQEWTLCASTSIIPGSGTCTNLLGHVGRCGDRKYTWPVPVPVVVIGGQS